MSHSLLYSAPIARLTDSGTGVSLTRDLARDALPFNPKWSDVSASRRQTSNAEDRVLQAIALLLTSSIPSGLPTLSQVDSGISAFTNSLNASVVSVKPFGTLTPIPDSFWYISPSEAPLPPTITVSSISASSNHFANAPDSIVRTIRNLPYNC